LYCHFHNINSADPWTWEVFPSSSVFNFFHYGIFHFFCYFYFYMFNFLRLSTGIFFWFLFSLFIIGVKNSNWFVCWFCILFLPKCLLYLRVFLWRLVVF
jgi:hypothetical protein